MRFKTKYHVCETQSTYCEIDASDDTSWADVMASCETQRSLGDIISVDGQGALATYPMYEKQIGSIGCPHWKRPVGTLEKAVRLKSLCRVIVLISFFRRRLRR